MAEAIGSAILAAVAVESTVIVAGLTTATVVGTVAIAGVSLGAQLAIGALTAADQKQKVASQQFSSRQPMPPRQRGYGWVKVAGPKLVYDSFGGRFFNAIYHGEGPIAGIEEWWLDDAQAAIAPNSFGGQSGIQPYTGQVLLESHLGTVGQAASGLLLDLPYWSPEHRLRGCAYTVMRAAAPAERNFRKVFPSGRWPETRVVARMSLVRDARNPAQTADPATWQFSDLSGPCIYDILTQQHGGLGVPHELMHLPSWAAFASRCDEYVSDRDGVVQRRYRLGGIHQFTDDPADTLTAMLATCDGRLTLEPDGTIGITGGAAPVVTVTLTDPRILSMTMEAGSSKLAAFNRLKTSYVSPAHDYQQVEGEPWDDEEAQDVSDELLEADFSRPWVPEHNQLQRLAKIHARKSNPDIRITGMVTDMSGAPALFEEAVRLVLTEDGIDETFLVNRAVANLATRTCTFDLVSLAPDTYIFDAQTEEGAGPVLPPDQASATPPPSPSGLIVTVERRAVDGETTAIFARLTCVPSTRADVALIGRYRPVGGAEWLDMGAEGENSYSVITSVLGDGGTYEAQGALATYGRTLQSPWLSPDTPTFSAVADPVAPDPPLNLVVTGGAGQITISFTAPNSANVARVRIYRAPGAAAPFASAVLLQTVALGPNQAFATTHGALSAGVYRYWATSVNGSGLPSTTAAGPANATVT